MTARDDRQRLRLMLLDFERRVTSLAEKSPDPRQLLERIARGVERVLESEITRIL